MRETKGSYQGETDLWKRYERTKQKEKEKKQREEEEEQEGENGNYIHPPPACSGLWFILTSEAQAELDPCVREVGQGKRVPSLDRGSNLVPHLLGFPAKQYCRKLGEEGGKEGRMQG